VIIHLSSLHHFKIFKIWHIDIFVITFIYRIEFYEMGRRLVVANETKAIDEGEHRVSGLIALRKTSSPPPFYFPEISRLDVVPRGEPAGRKDDRSEWRCARNSRASVLPSVSERTHARTIVLSLILSDWLAGLPICSITGEFRGTANRNYMVGATPKFALDGPQRVRSSSLSLFLSFSRPAIAAIQALRFRSNK